MKESPLLSSVVVQCSEIVIMDDYVGNLVRGGKSIFVCFAVVIPWFSFLPSVSVSLGISWCVVELVYIALIPSTLDHCNYSNKSFDT